MRAQTIAQLAWYLPYSGDTMNTVEVILDSDKAPRMTSDRIASIVHYAQCHKNLQFGWDFAQAMNANEDTPFPAILHGDDLYVWRAYNFLNGGEDSVIASALQLTLADNVMLANQIKALLVTEDITARYIADKLGMPEETIIAYEKLFFNVLDRKRDHAFLAQVIYPEGRLVEAAEDYIERTDVGEILLRAGFNNGAEHILYAMGLSNNPYGHKDVHDIATQLDRTFLSDGCLFAAMGWANQKRNARPILNARASLVAGKMGKGDTDGAGLPTITPGEILMTELNTLSAKKLEARSRILESQKQPLTIDIPSS